MDGRGATTESLLSDGASLLPISAAIKQHHLHKSIFHLLIIYSQILYFLINISGQASHLAAPPLSPEQRGQNT